MCTFWLVEALARAGDMTSAADLREDADLRQSAGPVLRGDRAVWRGTGQLSSGVQHLALISAAYNLDRFLDQGARHYAPSSERAMYRSG